MTKSPEEMESAPAELGDFMRMMDVVDIERRQDTAVQEQLSIDERKVAIKDQLRKTYGEMGVDVADSQLDVAINDHYDRKWSFSSAKEGFAAKLANAYVNRKWITKKIILPTFVGLGLIAGAYVGVQALKHQEEVRKEKAVEARVEQRYNDIQSLQVEIENVAASHFVSELPQDEKSSFNDRILNAKRKLDYTSGFFDEFTHNGEADKDVTVQNYESVDEKLKGVAPIIDDSKTDLNYAQGIIGRQGEFILIGKGLENLLGQVKAINPPEPLEQKATSVYEDGLSSIKTRQLEEAKKAQSGLTTILADARDFGNLSSTIRQLYNSAMGIAVEKSAIDKVTALGARGQSYVQNADVGSLRHAVSELDGIKTTLGQEYTIVVVNRPGIRSGLWRRSNDNPPRNSSDEDPQGKMFYLVCQAVEKDGDLVSLRLINSEDQRVENVSMFGVRIPHEIYLRVKKDKLDNGIVDDGANKYFLEKQKGYLSTRPIMKDNKGNPLPDMGYLTREENGWRAK